MGGEFPSVPVGARPGSEDKSGKTQQTQTGPSQTAAKLKHETAELQQHSSITQADSSKLKHDTAELQQHSSNTPAKLQQTQANSNTMPPNSSKTSADFMKKQPSENVHPKTFKTVHLSVFLTWDRCKTYTPSKTPANSSKLKQTQANSNTTPPKSSKTPA